MHKSDHVTCDSYAERWRVTSRCVVSKVELSDARRRFPYADTRELCEKSIIDTRFPIPRGKPNSYAARQSASSGQQNQKRIRMTELESSYDVINIG